MVVGGPTDIIDIASAQAFLASRRAGVIEFDFSEKMVLELIHPRWGEEDRRIPRWDQHIAGLAMMTLGLKERQVLFSQLVSFHNSGSFDGS